MLDSFNDIGISPILTTNIMQWLGLATYEVEDPVRFERIKDVINGLKKYKDPQRIINKLTAGKNVDKLDHVWGWLQLDSRMNEYESKMTDLIKQKEEIIRFSNEKQVDFNDLDDYIKVVDQITNLYQEIKHSQEEMFIYEK
jgi:hypothetical protein